MALALEPDLDGPFGSTEVMEPIYFDETGLRVMSTGSKYAQGQVMDPSTGLDRYYNPIKHQAPCDFGDINDSGYFSTIDYLPQGHLHGESYVIEAQSNQGPVATSFNGQATAAGISALYTGSSATVRSYELPEAHLAPLNTLPSNDTGIGELVSNLHVEALKMSQKVISSNMGYRGSTTNASSSRNIPGTGSRMAGHTPLVSPAQEMLADWMSIPTTATSERTPHFTHAPQPVRTPVDFGPAIASPPPKAPSPQGFPEPSVNEPSQKPFDVGLEDNLVMAAPSQAKNKLKRSRDDESHEPDSGAKRARTNENKAVRKPSNDGSTIVKKTLPKTRNTAYQLRAAGTKGYVPQKANRKPGPNKSRGVQRWAWPIARIVRYEDNNWDIPEWARDDAPFHAIESVSAAPANTSWKGLESVEITTEEIFAFAPQCLAQHGVTHRLARNGWKPTEIASAINMTHGVGPDEGIKPDTAKHMMLASDKAYHRASWAKVLKNNPTRTRGVVTDFTPASWLDKGACFKPADSYGLEDPYLVDMGFSIPYNKYPNGDGAKTLTNAIIFATTMGYSKIKLSQLIPFAQQHGLTNNVTPMTADADQRALSMVQRQLKALKKASRPQKIFKTS